MTALTDNATSTTAVDVATQRDIEQFLFTEADLLDDWKFREWLTLLDSEVHYWAPVRDNRFWRDRKKEIAAPSGSAYFDETFVDLRQRVDRIFTQMAWAENPPSRTRHLLSNIRVRETDDPTAWDVESSFYLHRTRTERDHDWIVGKRYDTIVRADNEWGFALRKRTVLFDVSTLLIKNLSQFY
ncbi:MULTISPECIES: 3-phenylpropionate/cinnamic acid dioxygenase subunit beta [unclassified Gordonia (in: high G+C Gram-positive bacteria)]|uniref:3-phenylpropionate/cinnamic acid dioxygenase subunit beta n=1 Tax=unclassified Gordonia (in: high G+C Gram-positive bacteria) TaxID=2657482 RepID=UPI0009AC04FA|nr:MULTISPECIES: 3-phenylpropionate/cinnamic acid dioxygenase subunit beta [unclassified Gordonia (in: high G+C Gram-positive bacteria)]MDF3282990.1 3-phenylpropionate/cinnamic acid dioxygenase subunit beta [Gordonia sp. N1V]OPX10777.1 hypothetical protein B1964_23290 [Gordonia sp. i37]